MADDRPHKAIARLKNRKFADSPLEGDGFELLVPRRESLRISNVLRLIASHSYRFPR